MKQPPTSGHQRLGATVSGIVDERILNGSLLASRYSLMLVKIIIIKKENKIRTS